MLWMLDLKVQRFPFSEGTTIFKSVIEPIAPNLHFSQWLSPINQTTTNMQPPLAICLWPVAMVASLTPRQLQKHCYPSGWSQDDPYHSNQDPSSHFPYVWVGEVLLCWFTSALKTEQEQRQKPIETGRYECECLHSFPLCSLHWPTATDNHAV